MITRDQALEELKIRVSDKKILRHSIAVEAVMKGFAKYYNADTDVWGMTGLLHDIDYDKTANNLSRHGIVAGDILENFDIDQAIVYSIRAHNSYNNIPRNRKMDKVLFVSGYITDVVIEGTLLHPDKKISEVTVEGALKNLESKNYCEDVNKNITKYLNDLGLTLEKFIEITLKAMQGISKELEF